MMSIASRTPEGWPERCPICGQNAAIDPSLPTGDAPCPACGHLLWMLREKMGLTLEDAQLLSNEQGSLDSLDTVELVMALEAQFDVEISDEEAQRIHSFSDLVRFLRHRGIDPI